MLKKITIEKSKQKIHFRKRNGKLFTAGSYVKHEDFLENLQKVLKYFEHYGKKRS